MTEAQAGQLLEYMEVVIWWLEAGTSAIVLHWACTLLWFLFSQFRRGPFHV